MNPQGRPEFQVLEKNAAFIHKLQLVCLETIDFYVYNTNRSSRRWVVAVYELPFFPNLSDLTIKQVFPNIPNIEDAIVSLVSRHRDTLRHFSYNRAGDMDMAQAIASCTQLREVECHGLEFKNSYEHWLSMFTILWSKVEMLSISGSWSTPLPSDIFELEEDDDPDSDNNEPETVLESYTLLPSEEYLAKDIMGPCQIRDLTIEEKDPDPVELEAHLWLIENSPSLERLRWVITESPMFDNDSGVLIEPGLSPIMDHLASAIGPKQHCQRLEALHLPDQRFDPTAFQTVIENLVRLTELDLCRSNFSLQDWSALKEVGARHLLTIRVLKLEYCLELEGIAVQEMLCSMPNLEVFKAGYLSDIHMENDGRPWACHGLRELSLLIDFQSTGTPSMGGQRMIQSRISKLKRLEVCTLRRPRGESLRMTLGGGLESLAGLSRMRIFHVESSAEAAWAQWGGAEVQWALDHWPDLERVSGMGLSDDARGLLLRAGFHGPSQPSCLWSDENS
ncbi:hypothetical protein BGZ83_009414 [Gryganskiella cystojenkinii]|nr:hypothetical protein BGZ83_009414 [Gryganskiella cystojenkinii]